jgi:hypothetical protein
VVDDAVEAGPALAGDVELRDHDLVLCRVEHLAPHDRRFAQVGRGQRGLDRDGVDEFEVAYAEIGGGIGGGGQAENQEQGGSAHM